MGHIHINISSTCTVNLIYKLLTEKLFQYHVSKAFWSEKLYLKYSEVFITRWNVLWESYKLPEIVEVDFKLYNNVIFTYEKMFKMCKTELSICTFCMKM